MYRATIENHPHTIFANEAAAKAWIAANDDGDGWMYEVRLDPKGSGRALVAISDEDNHFMGFAL